VDLFLTVMSPIRGVSKSWKCQHFRPSA
jgi:hypothetical protein